MHFVHRPNVNVSNTGLAPMEVDRVEKGKQKGKAKGKTKGKNSPKGKGKGKSDKGKGNHPRMHREQQRPMANAFTAGNMVTSNVIAGNCMVALTPRI